MNTDKILVCLYSDANFLSFSILENLLAKNCYVLVVTDEVEKWEMQTAHINNKSRFSFTTPNKFSLTLSFNYAIFCGGFINKEDAYKDYRSFIENTNIVANKNLAIFPFESFSPKEDASINVNSKLGVVYVGDLLGPRIDLNSNLLMPRIINHILQKREMLVAIGEIFYPVFVAEAAKTVSKWLFSFGPYGKSLFLLSPQVSTSEFFEANQKVIGQIKLKTEKNAERRYVPRNYETRRTATVLSVSLYETYKWLSSVNWSDQPIVKVKNVRRYSKKVKRILVSVLLIMFLPFLVLVFACFISLVSYKDVVAGHYNAAQTKLHLGKFLYITAAGESKILSYIPLIGLVYREINYIADIGISASDLAITLTPAIKNGSELFNKVLGDEVYDPSAYSEEISSDISAASGFVSDIQVESQESKTLSAKYFLKKIDIEKVSLYFNEGKVLAENLPSFLGAGGKKSYLVLFQNNMELRPTGGFIGSYGILSFDGGRMSGLNVSDVYSADGQLRGHVEPPAPIKNYLGEANWWLRDSNWDPDFPTTAQRSEWFLDKEVDQKVDGVVGIDLNIVKDALKLTGPIFLPDYNLSITNDNLYEETQAEAEEEFFPGSRQKASFITALSRSLVAKVSDLEAGGKMSFLYDILKNFSARHIQVFLHNDLLQKSFSALGWAGAVENPSCGSGCYADLVGITEANVGVNKANFFVDRKVDLRVTLKPGGVERILTLSIKNKANSALGPTGRYKAYIRVFIPQDSEIIGVKRVSGDYEENVAPEIFDTHGRHEVGVITEVLAGNSQKIVFSWQTVPSGNVEANVYGLYVRKQAGVTDDPWNIEIVSQNLSLTTNGAYTYNTVLTRDFVARVPW